MRATALSIITLSLASATVAAAATNAPTPADLLAAAPAPTGFELATDELRSQGFDDFSASSPYSVGHIQIGSTEADDLLAGQDVWGLGLEENLLREVVRWSSADVAELYQREVAAYAAGDALAEIQAPFEGAQAFSGSDPVAGAWVRIVVWTDGRYGAAVSHFASGGDPSDSAVNAAAKALASEIASASATADEDEADDATNGSTGGGIPLATVLVFVVIVGGAIWLFVRMRKRSTAARGDRSGSSRDSSDGSAAGDPPASSTDDIVAEARRKAREDVERTSERWQVPDDY